MVLLDTAFVVGIEIGAVGAGVGDIFKLIFFIVLTGNHIIEIFFVFCQTKNS